MWLSVFIVFSLVVFVWFRSFERRLAYLVNSDQTAAARVNQESPFSIMRIGFSDLRATILDLFGLAKGIKDQTEILDNLDKRFRVEPRLLPVAE